MTSACRSWLQRGRCRKSSAAAGLLVEPDDSEGTGGGDAQRPRRSGVARADADARACARAARLLLGRRRAPAATRPIGCASAPAESRVTRPLAHRHRRARAARRTTGVGRYLGELLRRWTARSDAAARRFILYTPEPLPLALPPGTAEHRVVGTRHGHVVGADPPAPRRAARSARRVLRARLHRAARRRRAAGGDDPRHLVRRPPRVVSPARGLRGAGSSRRARAAAASVVFTDSEFSRAELETRLRDCARHGSASFRRASRSDSDGRIGLSVGIRDSIASRWCCSSVALQPPAAARPHRRVRARRRTTCRDARLVIVGDNRTWPPRIWPPSPQPRRRRTVEVRQLRPRSRAGRALRARVGVRVPLGVRRLRPDPARSAGRRRADRRARHAGRARGLRRRRARTCQRARSSQRHCGERSGRILLADPRRAADADAGATLARGAWRATPGTRAAADTLSALEGDRRG